MNIIDVGEHPHNCPCISCGFSRLEQPTIYPMLAATNRFIGEIIPMTWRHVILLGGMRGAISVALVASLPPSNFKSILQTLTFGVVLLSLVIQYVALSQNT